MTQANIVYDEFYLKVSDVFLRRKGLTCTAKFLYTYLAFRQGANGSSWRKVRTIASELGISTNAVSRATASLCDVGLLSVTVKGHEGPHPTNAYVVHPLKAEGAVSPKRRHAVSPKRRQRVAETETQRVAEPETKNKQYKRDKENDPPTPQRPAEESMTSDKAVESIYAVYPKKVGRIAALLAIKKALECIGKEPNRPADAAAWLLERVQAFAASPAGQAGRFTPSPKTFFNDGRYDDDPTAWQQRDGNERQRPGTRTGGQRAGEFVEDLSL